MRRTDPERNRAIADWERAFGAPPPRYVSVVFMKKALAYQAQCKTSGGLPASTRRALRKIASAKSVDTAGISTGAHLVREWNGRTYQVEVGEGGYRMDDRLWPSLSAIAKHITGTTWSGPRFFGLTKRASDKP